MKKGGLRKETARIVIRVQRSAAVLAAAALHRGLDGRLFGRFGSRRRRLFGGRFFCRSFLCRSSFSRNFFCGSRFCFAVAAAARCRFFRLVTAFSFLAAALSVLAAFPFLAAALFVLTAAFFFAAAFGLSRIVAADDVAETFKIFERALGGDQLEIGLRLQTVDGARGTDERISFFRERQGQFDFVLF